MAEQHEIPRTLDEAISQGMSPSGSFNSLSAENLGEGIFISPETAGPKDLVYVGTACNGGYRRVCYKDDNGVYQCRNVPC